MKVSFINYLELQYSAKEKLENLLKRRNEQNPRRYNKWFKTRGRVFDSCLRQNEGQNVSAKFEG